jgi:hypothetical protein
VPFSTVKVKDVSTDVVALLFFRGEHEGQLLVGLGARDAGDHATGHGEVHAGRRRLARRRHDRRAETSQDQDREGGDFRPHVRLRGKGKDRGPGR